MMVPVGKLADTEMTFNLLLPDDETALSVRAESLSTWCQGFLTGLGLSGVQMSESNETTRDLREALVHLTEIAKLDIENIEMLDEDEEAYMEVTEYVRMVVFAIYDEYSQPAQSDQKKLH